MFTQRGSWALRAVLSASVFVTCACGGEPVAGVRLVPQQEVVALAETGGSAALLDVRTVSEFESGHVPGAANIPLGELSDRLGDLESLRGEEIIIYCERGGRANKAARLLQEAGFQRLGHLEGDMSGWRAADLPTQSP